MPLSLLMIEHLSLCLGFCICLSNRRYSRLSIKWGPDFTSGTTYVHCSIFSQFTVRRSRENLCWQICVVSLLCIKEEIKKRKKKEKKLSPAMSTLLAETWKPVWLSVGVGGINAGTAIEISCFIQTIEIYRSVQKIKNYTNLILKDK